ncbi:MAG: HAD family hydrolase [Bacilli bacterium]|nr:HAD family hydrolase [Bacilli bacterium]
MSIKVVLFDVDGTLVDSEPLYALSWLQTYRELEPNSTVSDKEANKYYYDEISGHSDQSTFARIKKQFPNAKIFDITCTYRKHFNQIEKTHRFASRPGAVELVNFVKQQKLRMGLVSCSDKKLINRMISDGGINPNDFEHVVAKEVCHLTKPNPYPYQIALAAFNVKPEEAIAIEDTESGLLSATRANIKCILVHGTSAVDPTILKNAYRVRKHLGECIEDIKDLMK